jgi:multidrug transporter EmrE-like cation transporter
VSQRPTPAEPAHGAVPQAHAGTHEPAAAPADDEVFQVTPGAHEPLADLAREAGARLHDSSHARRRWAAWMMLAVAIVGGAIGTSALAASAGFTRPGPVAVMAAGYLVCFIALTRALRVIPISVAYAVWSGVGITLVSASCVTHRTEAHRQRAPGRRRSRCVQRGCAVSLAVTCSMALIRPARGLGSPRCSSIITQTRRCRPGWPGPGP